MPNNPLNLTNVCPTPQTYAQCNSNQGVPRRITPNALSLNAKQARRSPNKSTP